MARRLDYSARFPMHSTREVYDALCDRDYWELRVEKMRAYSPNHVESLKVDDNGIEIVLQHVLPRSELPPAAQSVMRKDMLITRKETYSAFGDEVTGSYEASIPAGPGSLTGTMRLFPTEIGSTLRFSNLAKVYIPMLGPRLEQMMLVNLIDLLRAEAEATVEYLDAHQASLRH